MTTYTVDLCDGWQRIGEAPAATLDAVVRNLKAGEWRLTGAVDALGFGTTSTIADVDTIRVMRDTDNAIVFAGLVAPVSSALGGLELVHSADGDRFTLTGPDAWQVLASRVAYPTPATEPPWADAYDIRTGLASTVATAYLNANAGSSALAARQIAGLTVVDGTTGTSGTWSARLQPLDQLVTRICLDGGIVCRLTVSFDGALTATLRNPIDRQATVVFSDQGDLTNIQHITRPVSASFVVAGGSGLLTARTFATAGTATGANRIETFSDQSNLVGTGELATSAATTLAMSMASLTVRADITDTGAAAYRYLTDFEVGDTVSIETGDVRYSVVVDSVAIHVGPERQIVRPVFGDAVPNQVVGLIRDVADLQSRFDLNIA